MAQVFKSDSSLTFTVAMVTKMATNKTENRKLTILSKFETFDKAINIEHKQIPKIYFNR